MKKEDWINEVMTSAEGMKKAEANPFLFEKIALRIEQQKQSNSKESFSFPKWAVAASFVLLANIFSIGYILNKSNEAKKEKVENILSAEMGYSTTYNY